MTDKWVSMTVACNALDISESTLRRRIDQGKIKSKVEDGRRLVLIEYDGQMTTKEPDKALVDQLKGEIEYLRQELDKRNEQITVLEEGRQRQDTIMLQLTRQIEQSQRMLEYHQTSIWQRMFKRRKSLTDQKTNQNI